MTKKQSVFKNSPVLFNNYKIPHSSRKVGFIRNDRIFRVWGESKERFAVTNRSLLSIYLSPFICHSERFGHRSFSEGASEESFVNTL